MSYNYYDSLSGSSRERYRLKLDAVGLEECPYRIPSGAWKDDVTKWPPLQFGDLYTYLIKSPGVYTAKAMENYRGLEGHKFFISGWVQTMFFLETITGVVILKAQVRPSMRVNAEHHNPWVAVSRDGKVVQAHCDCMAGQGESCSHVGALLFKLEAAVRIGVTTPVCTDLPCTWNGSFVTDIQQTSVSNMKLHRDESRKGKSVKHKKRSTYTTPTSDEKDQLLSSLEQLTGTLPVGLRLFPRTYSRFVKPADGVTRRSLPAKMSKLFSTDSTICSDKSGDLKMHMENALKRLQSNLPSVDEIDYLSDCTTAQAQCVLWHEQRVGVITGSVAYDIIRTNIENPGNSYIKKVCYINSNQINAPPLKYGREQEASAFIHFKENVCAYGHANGCVEKTGMRLVQTMPWIGATADGLVTCQCHGKSVLEIKCPYKYRDSFVMSMCDNPDSFLDANAKLKSTSRYYYQVQLQMYVYDTRCCDFIVKCRDYHHELILRDDHFCNQMITHLDLFWKKHILPELLTRSLEADTVNDGSTNKENVKLYCYCQTPEDKRQYIRCDNPKCRFQWVHIDCAKLKRAPKESVPWFCKECRR